MGEINDVSAANNLDALERLVVSDLKRVGELIHSWICFARLSGLSKEYVRSRVDAMVGPKMTPPGAEELKGGYCG